MVREICLDSDVIISFLSNDEKTKQIIENLDADFYTTSINSFETWFGRTKSEKIFELLQWLKIMSFDKKASLLAGDILRDLKNKGEILEIRDVFIGSICVKNGIELLTFNKKHFERLRKFGLILTEY